SDTSILFHHRPVWACCSRVVKVYRYNRARIHRGGSLGNGSFARRPMVALSPCSSFAINGENHSCSPEGPIAANHISQSSRRWYGAICVGLREGFPGLPLNSYSRHTVRSDGAASVVPSMTIS